MKKLLKRVAIGLAVLLGLGVLGTAGLAVAIVIREDRTFDRPYPDLRASGDPAVIERGRYLVTGPAHCGDCHADPTYTGDGDAPMSGGNEWHLPVGVIRAPNITPDPETGIGRYTDAEVARVLREGVHPTGRAMVPFMPFANLSDEDLTAIVSYLRTLPPVRHAVPGEELTWVGRFARAFLLEPVGPRGPVPASVPRGATVEYGAYLANDVGNCVGCHTRRNLRTGEDTGPRFGGGMELRSHSDPSQVFVTPNLTPDLETGHITHWTEEMFVARFRNAVPTASPMPWKTFRRMTEDDLRAIYRYLRTLPPARGIRKEA